MQFEKLKKRGRVDSSLSICARFEKVVEFLRRVVTIDKSWVHIRPRKKAAVGGMNT